MLNLKCAKCGRTEPCLCHDKTARVGESIKDPGHKPPLGLKPKYIHDEQRKNEICLAIIRYSCAKKEIPREWLDELTALVSL